MDTPQTRREKEVWQACDDLWARGVPLVKISLEAITARLIELGYKKGSPNQIYQYRKSWKESREIFDATLESSQTVSLSDPISRAVALVRDELQTEANEKINEIQAEAEQRVVELQESHDQLKSQLHDILQRLEQKEKALEAAEKNLRELGLQLQEEKQAHKTTQTRADAQENFLKQYQESTEKQLADLKAVYNERKEYLTQQLTQLTKAHREEISEFKTLLEEQRDRWMMENEKLKSSYQQLEKEMIKLQSSEAQQKFINKSLQIENTALKDTASLSQEENQNLIKSIKKYEKDLIIRDNDLRHALRRETEKQTKNQNLQQQLLEAKKQIGRLEEQLNQLKYEKDKRASTIT